MSTRERTPVAELKVAEFVRQTGAGVIDMPLHDIAVASGVSDATVVRYCRREGYRGLKDYKIALSRRTEPRATPPLTGLEPLSEIRQRLISGCAQALYDTGERLNLNALEQAAQAIHTSGALDIYATGGSSPIASYLRHQLIKLGIRVSIYADSSSMRLSYAGFSRHDTVMSISVTGETPDVLEALCAAQQAGCRTICLTSRPESSLAQASDIVLEVAGGNFLLDSSYARISQLAVVDILYAALYGMK